ncbi:protein disulfide-isomerase TMX3-like [Takifugu rubripes]|uniref:protein disulfide-isomerase TMX3-like n=1 Tax=Takifugu rubripes TaxID=31033 RepID=UPI0011460A68|nr:protein disulfide-isomerase TMX3-like [Takifugu rubripes]
MSGWRNSLVLSALLALRVSAYVEELDDSFLETRGTQDVWLIKFYAPWCTFCKHLDPVWHQIGSELKSLGSPINVGKSDATVSMALAKEFRVRGYPAILMFKKGVKYNYSGPRTKDGIMDFAIRVGGPSVRALSSVQLFQSARSRHEVMFMYVGATSLLKGNYTAAAEELIVHTSFFSGSREVLPKDVSLPSLPSVVVFKDGTYFTFNEQQDGELKAWINRERFPTYSKIDSYSLYAMGESGKLVVLVLLEETGVSEASLRYKLLSESVAAGHRDVYGRHFLFGFMEGNDYINGIVMSEVPVPSFVVVNLAVDGYFLPSVTVETEQHLLDFLNGVLNGSIECQGGNGVFQRVRRLIYNGQLTLTPIFTQAPLLVCFLLMLPATIASIFCYLCCRARSIVADDDHGADSAAPLPPSPQQPKKMADKKAD